MKTGLRRQTFLIIVSICLVLIVTLMVSSRLLIMSGFKDLETEHVHQNVTQAWRHIEKNIQWLAAVAGDWAPWDDTYAFIQDQNSRYIDSDLSSDTLTNLDIHFMLFVGLDGRMVHAFAIDPKEKEPVALPKGLWERIHARQVLWQYREPSEWISGFLMFRDLPVLIASYPILTSSDEGPPRGALVIGKYLDTSEIKKIADDTGLSLSIHAAGNPFLPDDVNKAASLISDATPVVTLARDQEVISGYMVQNDIRQAPGFILKTEVKRKA